MNLFDFFFCMDLLPQNSCCIYCNISNRKFHHLRHTSKTIRGIYSQSILNVMLCIQSINKYAEMKIENEKKIFFTKNQKIILKIEFYVVLV